MGWPRWVWDSPAWSFVPVRPCFQDSLWQLYENHLVLQMNPKSADLNSIQFNSIFICHMHNYTGYNQQWNVSQVRSMDSEGLQILFKWFNLDSYYPLPYSYYHSMYNCDLSQSSHVDCQTLICVNPWQTWIRFRLIELVSMHLIMLMRLEPREVW